MSSDVVPSPVGRWFMSLRAYSFPASLMPVLLAAVLVAERSMVRWWMLPLYALAAVLFHAGTNVLNDYYDYRHGVDLPGDPDPTHAIPRGLVSPRFMAVSGHIYFFTGVLIGAGLALVRGPLFFTVGLAGALAAYLYTNARFSLKYRALGDVAVFLLMGPALVFIGVWALAGVRDWSAAPAALPIALLVTAILHGNNTRDIGVDGAAGVDTVARRLGFARSKRFFALLIVAGYAAVPLLAALGLVPWGGAAALLSLAMGIRLIRYVGAAAEGAEIMDIPLRSAKLHMVFSLLYAGGILLQEMLLQRPLVHAALLQGSLP